MAYAATWEDQEDIYHGEVPVILKSVDREDRSTTLTISMTYTTGQPRNQKVLHLQLTDESDLFLLYTLDISEDDFHALKQEQSIRVDFPTFPSKFIELLRECQSAAGEEHPRFVAMLSTLSGAPVLTVSETNPFRELVHLALRFVTGNDTAIKRHLAGRVAEFKAALAATNHELEERTQHLQETSELAATQSERLRTITDDHSRVVNEIEVRQASQIAALKETAAELQQEQASHNEQERQRLVERSEAELSALRQAHAAAAAQIAQLTSDGHELELKVPSAVALASHMRRAPARHACFRMRMSTRVPGVAMRMRQSAVVRRRPCARTFTGTGDDQPAAGGGAGGDPS